MATIGIIAVPSIRIVAVVELRVRIEHAAGPVSRHATCREDGVPAIVLAGLEETLVIEGAGAAQPEVDRRASARSGRVGPVARIRLVAEATHRTDQRRESCPLDTKLLAILDSRN